RHKNVGLNIPERVHLERLGARKVAELAAVADVGLQTRWIESAARMDCTANVLDRDNASARLMQKARGPGPDIAEALNGDARAFEVEAHMSGGLGRANEHAATGRVGPRW